MNCELVKVRELINDLTDDEDLRQDLWVHFLSGASSSNFVQDLEIISIYNKMIDEFQRGLETFVHVPLSEPAEYALRVLAPHEQQVVYLLLIGLTPPEIAEYKGIGLVRVRQMIASIRSSQAWKDLRRSKLCPSKRRSPKKNGSA